MTTGLTVRWISSSADRRRAATAREGTAAAARVVEVRKVRRVSMMRPLGVMLLQTQHLCALEQVVLEYLDVNRDFFESLLNGPVLNPATSPAPEVLERDFSPG